MCRQLMVFVATAALVLGAAAKQAQAGIAWSYDTLSSTDTVLSDNLQSSINFTLQSPASAVGTSNVVLADLTAASTTSDKTPDVISAGNYVLTLHLTDSASDASANVVFTGILTGELSAHSTTTQNTFNGPTTQTEKLGNNTYVVTIGPYVGPGPAGTIPGSIGAEVQVEPNGGAKPNSAAEPNSLVLGMMGIGCLGMIVWRRRR
jgi:hypothetical protein